MDRFVETILHRITRQGFNLSIVKNTDGFLSRIDTQEAFIKEAGVTLLPGSPLALRIHYERWYKGSGERFCYIVNSLDEILPDIKAEAFCCEFSVADVLWGYDRGELIRWNPPYSVLHYLFEKKQNSFLNAAQTREEMGYVAEDIEMYDLDKISEKIKGIQKKIYLVKEPFSIENQIMTPTMKLRRHFAKKFFENEINKLYEE